MSVLGLDIGTTGSKAVVFAADGAILSSAYEEYPPMLSPRPGWAELDSHVIWAAVQRVVAAAAAETPDPVEALSVSVFGESFLPVASNGEPLYNTILSFDPRAREQADRLTEKLGREQMMTDYYQGGTGVMRLPMDERFTRLRLDLERDIAEAGQNVDINQLLMQKYGIDMNAASGYDQALLQLQGMLASKMIPDWGSIMSSLNTSIGGSSYG